MLHSEHRVVGPVGATGLRIEQPESPRPDAAGHAPPRDDRHRSACRTEPNPSRVEHLHSARRPEVEQATRFQEEFALLRKEKGKPRQVNHLLIDLDLGEIRAGGEIGRDRRHHWYLHIEAGFSPKKPVPDLCAGAVVFRRGGSCQDIRVRLDIADPIEGAQLGQVAFMQQLVQPLGAAPGPPQVLLVLAPDEAPHVCGMGFGTQRSSPRNRA